MPQPYVYRARDYSGKLQTGLVEAEGTAGAVAALRERRLFVLDVRPAPEQKRRLIFTGLLEKKVGARDLAIFCRQFATVMEAGVPMMTCLDILARQAENAGLRRAVERVAQDLQEGRTLSDAMRRQPRVFPVILTSMVEAGEVGGVLDKALSRMADNFEREHDIREKVKSAMYYPAALVLVMILAVTFLVTYVLPNFMKILGGMNIPLPASTRFLMGASEFLGSYWYVLPPAIAGLLFATRYLTRLEQVRERLDTLKIRLPIFGPLVKKIAISRFCRTLATLLHAGVPVIQAMEIVKGTAGNAVVKRAAEAALQSVRDGLDLAGPLARSGVFPPMVSRMVAVGEETGTLDQLLEKVAQFYDREVNAGVSRLSVMLEPVLLIFMGVVIGGIVLSIMLPMINVMSGAGMPM